MTLRSRLARRAVRLGTWLLSLTLGWLGVAAAQEPGDGKPPGAKPNIVLILTDDEDAQIHAFMPKTKALLEDRGVQLKRCSAAACRAAEEAALPSQ